jgi:hypothetical protein
MHRFDNNTYDHVLDEIVFYKSKSFPPKFTPFTRKEPPNDNSLETRKKWDIWLKKKAEHEQSDSAQYDLIYNKLHLYEQTLTAVYSQLKQTIVQIREMNEAVMASFADIPLAELKKMVASIPAQIQTLAKQIHQDQGIIIKQSDLKLTPAFLKILSSSNPSLASTEREKKAQSVPALLQSNESDGSSIKTEAPNDSTKSDKRQSRNNRESFVSFGGLPMETVLPILQSLNSRRNAVDEKASRRFTLW